MTTLGDAGLTAAVSGVAAWLGRAGVRGALIGGVAVSVLGQPRTTRDVDVVVWLPFASDWPGLIDRMGPDLAFRPGGSFEFALESRVLLLRHVHTGIDVDVSLGALEIEEELVTRALIRPDSGLALPLPTPEHLVILKALASRPRDLADIEGLLLCQPQLDREYVRRVVTSLSTVLEAPELADRLDDVLRRVPARSREP